MRMSEEDMLRESIRMMEDDMKNPYFTTRDHMGIEIIVDAREVIKKNLRR